MSFSFGAGSKPASTTGGFSFTGTKTTSSGFNLGGTTSTVSTGFSFANTATAKPTGTGFGGFGTASTASKPAATGFSFGNTATATAAPTSTGGLALGGSLFNTTKTTAVGSGLTFGATAAPTATGTSLFTTTTQASKPFVGLGGTDITTTLSSQNGGTTNVSTASQALKDQALPNEIYKNVQDFEKYIEKQKAESVEVGKFSVHTLYKVRAEMTALSNSLGAVSSALQRNTSAVERLKNEFNAQLQHMAMAQRTQDIPPTLQHDNIEPIKYFIMMVNEFESNIQMYRQQIEQLEHHLAALDQPNTLTIKDISLALCKIQESFISVGSNLYAVHTAVQALKEQYLLYRRIIFGDTVDVFKRKTNKELPKVQSGPSPFGQLGNVAALAIASVVNQQLPSQPQQQPAGFGGQTGSLFGNTATKSTTGGLFGGSNTNTLGGGFGGFGTANKTTGAFGASNTSSLFGGGSTFNTAAGTTFGGSAANTFQLQKPPAGNKRGKK